MLLRATPFSSVVDSTRAINIRERRQTERQEIRKQKDGGSMCASVNLGKLLLHRNKSW